jgi:hypothetical protein
MKKKKENNCMSNKSIKEKSFLLFLKHRFHAKKHKIAAKFSSLPQKSRGTGTSSVNFTPIFNSMFLFETDRWEKFKLIELGIGFSQSWVRRIMETLVSTTDLSMHSPAYFHTFIFKLSLKHVFSIFCLFKKIILLNKIIEFLTFFW